MSSPEEIAERFRLFAEEPGIPFYRQLSLAAAEQPWICELLTKAKPGQARPVLLLAAVHRLVLDRPDAPLARFYPSVTGEPVPGEDPAPDFLAFCREHLSELGDLVATRSTQTNEVNRSVAVAAVLRAATADLPDVPVALVELGPSAGLNLRADTYAVDVGDRRLHQRPESPVRLVARLEGDRRPDLDRELPPIVDRVGLDLDPIDVRHDVEDVRWLESCLWPEQLERFTRFRSAVAEARIDPPRLVRGDLLDDLPALLDSLPPGAHAFVFHSWVLTYVARARRPELLEVLRRAAATRPISWLAAEAPNVVPKVATVETDDGGLTLLNLTTWRDGEAENRLLGTCHPHLVWLEWRA